MKRVFSLSLLFFFLLCSVNTWAEQERKIAPEERIEAPRFRPEHRPKFSKEDLQNWNIRAYKEFYFRFSYVFRRLKKWTLFRLLDSYLP